MTHSGLEDRIRELNYAKTRLVEAEKKYVGTDQGFHVFGLRAAVNILMARKKELRMALTALREKSAT